MPQSAPSARPCAAVAVCACLALGFPVAIAPAQTGCGGVAYNISYLVYFLCRSVRVTPRNGALAAISGASVGIGRAIASKLAGHGFRTALIGRSVLARSMGGEMQAAGIPADLVLAYDEVFADAQVLHRGMVAALEQPGGDQTTVGRNRSPSSVPRRAACARRRRGSESTMRKFAPPSDCRRQRGEG